ncbi:hypothetical protein ACS0TY_024893 [Phlomoides rotata]
MEYRRRNNNRRSQNKRPPRGTSGNWKPTVPSWEKEFCRVIGSLDWETLLQMKKFMHLYDNVIKWDDSAGEEAFSNAKKRFWAEINGFPCDVALPDPDLYIDEIDWDSETCPQLLPDFESEPVVAPNVEVDHDPVVIFGDTLLPNEAYTLTGWGDEDENFKAPQANSSSANQGSPWVQNWGNSFDNGTAIGWPDYSNSACNFGDGSGTGGYMAWGNGWNNEWGWNYNNDVTYGAQPHMEQGMADGGWGQWNDNGGNVSTDNGGYKTTYWGQQSCGPSNHHSAITVGQAWHQ